MKITNKLSPIALATTLALGGLALIPTAANAELSGNIGVHSKYLLRGIFEENPNTAVQGGLDYSDDSGIYIGWWASNLGYTYDRGTISTVAEKGVENDFYAGFSGEAGDIGYSIGLIQYLYVNVDDSNLTELTGTLSMGDGYVGFQYLLTDGWWGNAGDNYLKAGYSFGLPKDFGLAFDLGYYIYNDDDAGNPELGGVTTQTSAFRHLNVTLSHAVGTTGAEAYVQYTFAGEDRSAVKYDNSMVMGVTYAFDL